VVVSLRKRKPAIGAPEQSALDELLATEQELAAHMAAAAREAESLIAAARAQADAIKLEGDAALGVELAQAEANAAAARFALVRTLEAEGGRLVVRYRTLTETEISSMAAFIICEATGLIPGESR
jgi:hypothetical protein